MYIFIIRGFGRGGKFPKFFPKFRLIWFAGINKILAKKRDQNIFGKMLDMLLILRNFLRIRNKLDKGCIYN